MSYAGIDPQIRAWATKHKLILSMYWEGGEVRSIHVSSLAGECFQIWIECPVNDFVAIHADCVEGRRANTPPENWLVRVREIDTALEHAFERVIARMAPSSGYLPEVTKSPSNSPSF